MGFKVETKFEVKNSEGKVLGIFDRTIDYLNDQVIVKKDNDWSLIDDNGETLRTFDYADIGIFENGIAKVTSKEGKSGLINMKLIETVPPMFDWLAPYDDYKEFYYVRIGKHFGAIDKNGKLVVSLEHRSFLDVKSQLDFILERRKESSSLFHLDFDTIMGHYKHSRTV